MTSDHDIRMGEIAVAPPPATDAGLVFIGRIRTPWTARAQCPRRGSAEGPVCRIEVFEPWIRALDGVAAHERLEILYWLHLSRRDLVLQSPSNDGSGRGTFSIRSPVRPNPIGASIVSLVAQHGPVLMVRGLDCVDLTPLLDIKPDRSGVAHLAPRPRTATEDTGGEICGPPGKTT